MTSTDLSAISAANYAAQQAPIQKTMPIGVGQGQPEAEQIAAKDNKSVWDKAKQGLQGKQNDTSAFVANANNVQNTTPQGVGENFDRTT